MRNNKKTYEQSLNELLEKYNHSSDKVAVKNYKKTEVSINKSSSKKIKKLDCPHFSDYKGWKEFEKDNPGCDRWFYEYKKQKKEERKAARAQRCEKNRKAVATS